jgi:hypothetical protein
LEIVNKTTHAINRGSFINFIAAFDGTLTTSFGAIGAFKTNATANNFSSYFSIFSRNNGSALAEGIRLHNTGNVSIDNGGSFTDAGFKLDVQGTLRASGAITASSTISASGLVTANSLAVTTTSTLTGLASYASDLSGSYTARSLVDKGYVDASVGGLNQAQVLARAFCKS